MSKQLKIQTQGVVRWQEEGFEDDSLVSVKFHEINQHADADLLDKLAALGDELEQMAWKIGWLTDKLYKNLMANKADVDYMWVCYYVSVTKLKGQRSMNTVKYWALTARFFPEQVAKKYNYDLLPMSHFNYASTFNDLRIDNVPVWQMVLDYSWDCYINSATTLKRFTSKAKLKERFEGMRVPERPKKTPSGLTENFTPSFESAAGAEFPVNENIASAAAEVWLPIIGGLIQNFTMAIGNYLPVLQKSSPDIGQALAGVLSNLDTIAGRLLEE